MWVAMVSAKAVAVDGFVWFGFRAEVLEFTLSVTYPRTYLVVLIPVFVGLHTTILQDRRH